MAKNEDPPVRAGGAVLGVVTPLAMANISREFDAAARHHEPGDKLASLVTYYLFCVSIELAAKSAILATDCTLEMKKSVLKNEIGHDLVKAVERAEKAYDRQLLDAPQQAAVNAVSPYFKGKALEYFTELMLKQALKAYRDLPPLEDLAAASKALQEFVEENERFINAKSSATAGPGLFTLV